VRFRIVELRRAPGGKFEPDMERVVARVKIGRAIRSVKITDQSREKTVRAVLSGPLTIFTGGVTTADGAVDTFKTIKPADQGYIDALRGQLRAYNLGLVSDEPHRWYRWRSPSRSRGTPLG
jgi:hypothetical protein